MKRNDNYIFVDYEGTLSEVPKGSGENQKVTLADLLFGDVFSKLKPNQKIRQFLLKQNTKNIYVLGVVDSNREIKQKEQWLRKHYRFISKDNYIFISGERKKVDVINEFVKFYHINPKDIIFIDDKVKHLTPAVEAGYTCIDANEIV